MFWKFLRKLGIRKPFKGNIAYEWQIFMLVFQVYYPHAPLATSRKHWGFKIWYDSFWRR